MANDYDADALAVPGSRPLPRRQGVTITIAPPAKASPPPSSPGAPQSPAAPNPVQPQPARTGRIGADASEPPAVAVPAPSAASTTSGGVALHPVQPQPAIPQGLPNGGGSGAPSAPIHNGLIASTNALMGLDAKGTSLQPSPVYDPYVTLPSWARPQDLKRIARKARHRILHVASAAATQYGNAANIHDALDPQHASQWMDPGHAIDQAKATVATRTPRTTVDAEPGSGFGEDFGAGFIVRDEER